MPAIIRLARHGKKGQAFYHIVVADKRFARNARFIEKLGTYNPCTNPASVVLQFDKAVEWLQKGARPSPTVRSIFSGKGVLLKAHLEKGIRKGALTAEQGEALFRKWESEQEAKISSLKYKIEAEKRKAEKKQNELESASRKARSEKRGTKTKAADGTHPTAETVQLSAAAQTDPPYEQSAETSVQETALPPAEPLPGNVPANDPEDKEVQQ